MSQEPLTKHQESNRRRRQASIDALTLVLVNAGPVGISRADLIARSGLGLNLVGTLLTDMRKSKRAYIAGWYHGKIARQPLFAYGNQPDAPLPPKGKISVQQVRDADRVPQKLETILTKEVIKQHKAWQASWVPRPDPAAAWMRAPIMGGCI